MNTSEAELLSRSRQQAYRNDIDKLTESEIDELLTHFGDRISANARKDIAAALTRIYEELVRDVRLRHTGSVNRPSDPEPSQNRKKLSTQTAAELRELSSAIDKLQDAFEHLSPPGRSVLDRELRQIYASIPTNQRPSFRKLWDQASEPLQSIGAAASNASIEVKRGRDESELHKMVGALVVVWTHCTGSPPQRSYNAGHAEAHQSGEAGALLKLARAIAKRANEQLGKEGMQVGSRSLSKIVRDKISEHG